MKLATDRNTQTAVVDIDSRNRIVVTGNTFPIKDDLKELGMRWDGAAKAWYYKPKNDDDAMAFLKKLNDYAPNFESFDADMVEFVNSL